MSDDEKYMRLALAEADAAATEGEVPIGAVVVCDGQVVARAHNRRELDLDPSAHAEFSAMVEASRVLGRWRLSGCTVYVTLEPCLMCAGLMVNARIDRCVFGASDPKGGALGTLYDVRAEKPARPQRPKPVRRPSQTRRSSRPPSVYRSGSFSPAPAWRLRWRSQVRWTHLMTATAQTRSAQARATLTYCTPGTLTGRVSWAEPSSAASWL